MNALDAQLDAFQDAIRAHLAEGNGSRVVNRLLEIYMSPTNKRNITLCIQTEGATLIKVDYGMPVPESASRLFLPTQSAAAPLPSSHIHISDHVGTQNFRVACGITHPTWADEKGRLTNLMMNSTTSPAARRGIAHVLRYWRIMEDRILAALVGTGVDVYNQGEFKMQWSSSQRARTRSSNRPTPRRSSTRRRSTSSSRRSTMSRRGSNQN